MLQKAFNILATSLSVIHNYFNFNFNGPSQNYFQICISVKLLSLRVP